LVFIFHFISFLTKNKTISNIMSSNNENVHPNAAIDLSIDSDSDDDDFMPKPVVFHNNITEYNQIIK